MPCREHYLLFEKYRALLEKHNQNLKRLCDAIGYIPHVEFEVLWKQMQHTRDRLQEAQRTLQKHISEHEC